LVNCLNDCSIRQWGEGVTAAHTKWVWCGDSLFTNEWESILTAYDYYGEPCIECSDENKALIAAAPDLLAALQGLIADTDSESAWARAFAAIKKANSSD
jgi:hypothetical protein